MLRSGVRRAALLALLLGTAVPAGAGGEDAAGAGEAGRGERVFQRCYACHSVEPGEVAGPQGPNLRGIVGRPIAAQPGFDYSGAMRRFAERRGVWTVPLLARFLAAPERLVPGTAMSSAAPLEDAGARADLIAYLLANR